MDLTWKTIFLFLWDISCTNDHQPLSQNHHSKIKYSFSIMVWKFEVDCRGNHLSLIGKYLKFFLNLNIFDYFYLDSISNEFRRYTDQDVFWTNIRNLWSIVHNFNWMLQATFAFASWKVASGTSTTKLD